MQLLSENRRLGTPLGRNNLSILPCQDLAVLTVLFLIIGFAVQDDKSPVILFLTAMGQAEAAVLVIRVLERPIIRGLFRLFGSAVSGEMFLALVLLVIIGTSLFIEAAGLSLSLGAFLAGILYLRPSTVTRLRWISRPLKVCCWGYFLSPSACPLISRNLLTGRSGWRHT